MAYVVISPSGEESLNIFLNPDPDAGLDHLGGGQSHAYNSLCTKSSESEQ